MLYTIQLMNAGQKIDILSIGAVIAAASIFGLTYSLTAPLIALQLAQCGYGEFYIGLNAAIHNRCIDAPLKITAVNP
jgi:hypothetical protein